MSLLKRYISTFLLILVVYSWYFFTYLPVHPKTLTVSGARTNVQLYDQPDSGHMPIIAAIQSARREILVEVYLLSDNEVIHALEDARNRGVDVKVMLEGHPFGGRNLNKKTKTELNANNIQTTWSNPSFALTHEKAIIIDDNEALILSQNLTASSFSKNREYDIFDTNPFDVQEIRNIFIADWERKSFSPPSQSDIIESPNNSRAALTTLLSHASHSIDIEAEDIDDNAITTLRLRKGKNTYRPAHSPKALADCFE